MASRLSKQNERYQALCQELNPRTTQVEPSHDLLYRDIQPLNVPWSFWLIDHQNLARPCARGPTSLSTSLNRSIGNRVNLLTIELSA